MSLEELGYKGKKLEKLISDGISTEAELLYKEPRKYLFFNKVTTLCHSEEIYKAAEEKTPVVVKATLLTAVLDKVRTSNISVIKMKLENKETETKLYVNIFGAYRTFSMYERYIDEEIYVGGVIQHSVFEGKHLLSISNPMLFTSNEKDLRVYPVYRKYKGISEDFYKNSLRIASSGFSLDYIPPKFLSRYGLVSYKECIDKLHNPSSEEDITSAKKRMTFDSMLYFASKVENTNEGSRVSSITPNKEEILNSFISSLPYELTGDQKNAIDTIKNKMRTEQTSALVQGDVSCGKTVVAMSLMMLMAENGYQSVLIAPTVILAKQHYEELSRYASQFDLSVAFLSSDTPAKDRKKLIEEVKAGKHLLIVGTHSCFSKGVEYSNLGLVITDEEHKFGVVQRESIRSKADEGVHTITMSATPIPRTIASTIYGDNIEVITIKQMPNGRKPVKTAVCVSDKPVFSFIKKELDQGNQCYVVCPLIDEAEEDTAMSGISSVEDVAKKYRKVFEPYGYKVGVITGKTSSEEIAATKKSFSDNEIQILVATTVIEVGVNVPNATVIAITSAERFGLATLHQLRGRVGRGTKQSYCILQKTSDDKEGKNLDILCGETDGFEIAKADLKNRGTGNILGTQQSGKNRFIELIIEYPKMYSKVKEIAKSLSRKERDEYIREFEERYPSCL